MDTIMLWIAVFSKNLDGTGLQSERAASHTAIANNHLATRKKDELFSNTELEDLRVAIENDDIEKVKSMVNLCRLNQSDSRYRRQVRNCMCLISRWSKLTLRYYM
jgi:hypothetical protein